MTNLTAPASDAGAVFVAPALSVIKPMDEIQAIALVAKLLGTKPFNAVYQTFGHNSVIYEVLLPERSVIVRMNEDASVFAATERNIAALADIGLPVPRVLMADLSKSHVPFAYILLEKIPGRDLRYELPGMTTTQMTRLAGQIVDAQRRVSRLPPGTGYGYVGLGETGPYTSWRDLVFSENSPMQTARVET